MYTYGEKIGLTENAKKFIMKFEEQDEISVNVGKKVFFIGTERLVPRDIKDTPCETYIPERFPMEFCEQVQYIVNDLTDDDIESLENYIENLKTSLLKTCPTEKVADEENLFIIYRVIKRNEKYQQLCAIKDNETEEFTLYIYDDELELRESIQTSIMFTKLLEEYIKNTFEIVRGLPFTVVAPSDYTSKGPTRNNRLYVTDSTSLVIESGCFEINKLKDLLIIQYGKDSNYIAKPAYKPNSWYMKSNSYITTSDCRYKFAYPIPVFDKTE